MKVKRFVVMLIAFSLVICMIPSMSAVALSEYSNNNTISNNTTINENANITGTLTINNGVTLTVPAGITLTIKDGATLSVKGNIVINGKLVVEKGGRFYRKEYGIYQQIVGPESDIGSFYCPLLAIYTGAVEVLNSGFNFPTGSAVRVARSSIRLWNEVWTMEHETEVKYCNNVMVNVTIIGPDTSENPALFARLILGGGAINSELRLLPLNTFYWLHTSDSPAGSWCRFSGLDALSGSIEGASEEMLTWANAFWENARMLEPELTADEGMVYRNQVYDNSRDTRNQYNLFIPSSVEAGDTVSLILFTHGGSWLEGAKEDMDYACARMARQGYITATIDYRLFEAEQNAATCMEDLMDDMKNCINAICAQCERMGISIDKMATSGYSAGGHLALLYAYSCTNAAIIPVELVFEQVGPADFDPTAFQPGLFQFKFAVNTFAKKLIPGYANMTAEEKAVALDEISPVNYVDENTVPSVISYASEDIIVGYQHGVILNDLLYANNIDHVFFTLEKSNHTCEFDSEKIDEYWTAAVEYCSRYLTSQE